MSLQGKKSDANPEKREKAALSLFSFDVFRAGKKLEDMASNPPATLEELVAAYRRAVVIDLSVATVIIIAAFVIARLLVK